MHTGRQVHLYLLIGELVMGCTVLATTKCCTVDQVNRSVQTSPLVTSAFAGVISEHMEVSTIFQKGYSDNVVVMMK